MTNVLFLWDADAFGGHDVSAFAALERLVATPGFRVGVMHTGRNERLIASLQKISRKYDQLEIIVAEGAPTLSESIDGIVRGPRTRSIQKVIQRWQPDLAVNIQGFITLGLCAMGACRSLGVPIVSYVPMTHRLWHLHRSPISLLQDIVNRYWYHVPNAFITTSQRMCERLVVEQGVPEERVTVVEYGPDLAKFQVYDRKTSREYFGFDAQHVVAVIGRVEFHQKQQDFFIQAVAANKDSLEGFRFVIVGDGPDLSAAMQMVKKLEVDEYVYFMSWQDDMTLLYPALDAVLIPSRYEGVPLVMLEAMACRVPVLASDVDGMTDFLPSECLFGCGDAADMISKIKMLPGFPGDVILDDLVNIINEKLNSNIFANRFVETIDYLAKK